MIIIIISKICPANSLSFGLLAARSHDWHRSSATAARGGRANNCLVKSSAKRPAADTDRGRRQRKASERVAKPLDGRKVAGARRVCENIYC